MAVLRVTTVPMTVEVIVAVISLVIVVMQVAIIIDKTSYGHNDSRYESTLMKPFSNSRDDSRYHSR